MFLYVHTVHIMWTYIGACVCCVRVEVALHIVMGEQ